MPSFSLIMSLGLVSLTGNGIDPVPCPNPVSSWTRTGEFVHVRDIALPGKGDVLLAGDFAGTVDFDPSDGLDEHTSNGGYDGFVVKIHGDGSYGWTYTVGAAGSDSAAGVASGADDTVFVAGSFLETVDFDPTDAVDERTAVGERDAFLTKLGSNGVYHWTLTFGAGGEVGVSRVAVDPEGNVILIGNCDGTGDFDPGPGVDNRYCWVDFYVMKLSAEGTRLWAYTIGAYGTRERGTGVAVDRDGNIYVTGLFEGIVDFDPSAGVDRHMALSPYEDIFITKFRPDGSYAWTRTYNARFPGMWGMVAADPAGGAVVTGGFAGTVDFNPLPGETDWRIGPDDNSDTFVTKVNGDGSYAWTYTVGEPTISDIAVAAAIDQAGNVYAIGDFWKSMDFDPGPGLDVHTSNGADDIFVVKLGAGGSYAWTRTFGGDNNESPRQIAVDRAGAVIAVGSFWARPTVDFDPGCELDLHEAPSEYDIGMFITKLVCPDLTTDLDGDGDTDLLDFAEFQNCFTDEAPVTCNPGCSRLDLDPDDDVDLTDFADFLLSLTGP